MTVQVTVSGLICRCNACILSATSHGYASGGMGMRYDGETDSWSPMEITGSFTVTYSLTGPITVEVHK